MMHRWKEKGSRPKCVPDLMSQPPVSEGRSVISVSHAIKLVTTILTNDDLLVPFPLHQPTRILGTQYVSCS